jgi:hypothetical protein
LGGGNAWHQGYNLPYLVLATGISFASGPAYRIELGGEIQWLRVTSDRFQRTIQNGEVTAEQSLGRVHRWSHGVILGLKLGGGL